MIQHDKRPGKGRIPDDEIKHLEQLFTSPYSNHIKQLEERISGKKVRTSSAGSSGYVLFFYDNTRLIIYLVGNRLTWMLGNGELSPKDMQRINNEEFGDGYEPLHVNLPYANEYCDIAAQVANAHGKPVTGLAIGKDTFNVCFPEGMELDAWIVPDKDDRLALRVFWEQW